LSSPHFASAAGIVIISMFAILVIAMASLPVAIVVGESGAAMAFGVVIDLIKMPVFARLRISRKAICI
jgi:H+-transporting ATPase